MPLFTWTDDLSVGIRVIDSQHQELFQIMNDLHEAMMKGEGAAVVGTTTDRLAHYTAKHFSTEERYFDRFGYSRAPSHKLEHSKFIQKIAGFRQDLAQGRVLISVEMMAFLKDWLVNHIKGNDRQYISCFQENGLK